MIGAIIFDAVLLVAFLGGFFFAGQPRPKGSAPKPEPEERVIDNLLPEDQHRWEQPPNSPPPSSPPPDPEALPDYIRARLEPKVNPDYLRPLDSTWLPKGPS